ncbi:MAG TPA: hypothetical protein VGR76_11355 [Candidatus Angelobacter sp.]|nr:hypothetical protein [Candidatus Angelobacter sp.]
MGRIEEVLCLQQELKKAGWGWGATRPIAEIAEIAGIARDLKANFYRGLTAD